MLSIRNKKSICRDTRLDLIDLHLAAHHRNQESPPEAFKFPHLAWHYAGGGVLASEAVTTTKKKR